MHWGSMSYLVLSCKPINVILCNISETWRLWYDCMPVIAYMLGMVTHLGFAVKAIHHYCIDVLIRHV